MRDDANLNQLLVFANMESYNAILIEQGKPQSERLINRNALCWQIRLQGITFTRHSFFDKLYAQMNEAEKREFLSQLVDKEHTG